MTKGFLPLDNCFYSRSVHNIASLVWTKAILTPCRAFKRWHK
ncbi:MAG: hypothetical protein Q8N27_05130 [Candidatus Hydromicrobium sp.]|nr:hypothetical protein [Candidatus Hydromicrobium sp.]